MSGADEQAWDVEARLTELGITLKPAPAALASYIPVSTVPLGGGTGGGSGERLAFVAGQLPWVAEGEVVRGKVGGDLSEEDGAQAMRLAALATLATKRSAFGNLNCIQQVVKAECYINTDLAYEQHAKVANGCSDFFQQVFGVKKGSHSRIAVGVSSLPLGAAVEIATTFRVVGDLSANSNLNA